jgi:murein L,D-transpeptidase YafK
MWGPRHGSLAVAALAIALAGCPKRPPAPPVLPPEPPPPPSAEAPPCKRVVRIDIVKSERRLVASCEGGGRLEFPIALSRERGPKRRQGDQRMPEGDYRVSGPPRTSRFHIFIPFDYPSRADADRALAEKRIDADVHAAIARAHARRRMPPQDTPLGGALGIHGEGVRWRGDLALNWTEGCVAVSDKAIEQLSRIVRPGTPIRIEP